jgi:hypothetical protein
MTDIADIVNRVCEENLSSISKATVASVISYLKNEWINNSTDLYAVLQDQQSWQALNIPVRLKLALAEYMDTLNTAEGYYEQNYHEQGEVEEEVSTTSPSVWRRDWDDEKQYWYYWNTETHESYWDENQDYEGYNNYTEDQYADYEEESKEPSATAPKENSTTPTTPAILTQSSSAASSAASLTEISPTNDITSLLQSQFNQRAMGTAPTAPPTAPPADPPAASAIASTVSPVIYVTPTAPCIPDDSKSIIYSSHSRPSPIKTLPRDDPNNDPNEPLYPPFTSELNSTISTTIPTIESPPEAVVGVEVTTSNNYSTFSSATATTTSSTPTVQTIVTSPNLVKRDQHQNYNQNHDRKNEYDYNLPLSLEPAVPMNFNNSNNDPQIDSNMATPTMMLSGMLYKKSRKHALIGAKWQRRWFEVTHNSLNYYKHTEEEELGWPSSPKIKKKATPQKIKKMKAGMDVMVQWGKYWLPARIIKVQSLAPKCDVIVLDSELSSKVGMSNKWLKNVHRNQVQSTSSKNSVQNVGEQKYLGMVESPKHNSPEESNSSKGSDDTKVIISTTVSSSNSSSNSSSLSSDGQKEDVTTKSTSPTPTVLLRGKSLLKSIPLTSIVAVLQDTSCCKPLEFAIALKEGRVLELRAPTEENAQKWLEHLDARVRSASIDNDEIPLPPAFTDTLKVTLPTSPIAAPAPLTRQPATPIRQVKSDEEIARELQAQFDAEDNNRNSRQSSSGSNNSVGSVGSVGNSNNGSGNSNNHDMTSLLFRLSQGGSSPASRNI